MFSSGQIYHYHLQLLIMMGLNLSPIQIVEIGRDKRRYHLKKASLKNHIHIQLIPELQELPFSFLLTLPYS